jgi:hypothetical protein
MHRSSSVTAVLVLAVVALCLPLSLALTATALAQEPEPPTGEPQEPEPAPEEPAPEEPAPEEPAPEEPATEVGGGGTLPRTGWDDALLYFCLGVVLILAGARLRVVSRIKQAVERVRRRNTQVALREALEPIRAARLSAPEPDPDPGPLHVEPSTPTARRLTGVAERD